MLGLGLNSLTNAGGRPLQWNPLDVGSGELTLWLTARAQDVTVDESNLVESWLDRGPAGNHASQETSGKSPVFNEANNIVTFDNTGGVAADDYMGLTELFVLEPDVGWVIAARYTSVDWDGSAQTILGAAGSSNHIAKHDSGAATFSVKASGQTRTVTLDTPAALVDGTFYTIIFSCTASGVLTLYIDGVAQVDTETFGSTKDLSIDTLCGKGTDETGAYQTLGGDLKEIIVFNGPLRTREIGLLNQFMERASY